MVAAPSHQGAAGLGGSGQPERPDDTVGPADASKPPHPRRTTPNGTGPAGTQARRRVTRSAGVTLLPAALMGALLLTVSDFAAQRVLAPIQLPVGIRRPPSAGRI
ncbi:hypothetical protein [Streptomyces albipurpureus]|uniref:MFS transporter n=1 Tax=Streptomyces albipurpureus TaxID=2897419 RepID=A0ABT0UF29_9ACTN|nr:hypothetical protein [Streptomyces sp. CWNU-1]MCM2386954.1 hypothetical protein [Streptomyces sp. CWNU-1]